MSKDRNKDLGAIEPEVEDKIIRQKINLLNCWTRMNFIWKTLQ